MVASLFTEPFPSFLGLNLNYNLIDFMRLSVGFGNISYSDTTLNISATTVGGDVKLFIPRTSISPFGSIGYTLISGTRTGTGKISTLGNVTPGQSVVTFGAGLDYQSRSGFNIGIEFKANSGDSSFIPGGYIGYFF
ncbi:MAG: hypothetical protein JST80_01990 [Bdellovibrionales bacterium]|nr:hypothetical protein [Bdellovibrionales bacterium]